MAARGSVVDMRCDGALPAIHTLLRAGEGGQVAIEALAQRDARQVRGIAQGLARGLPVQDTGATLWAPVGKTVLLTEMIHNMNGHQEGVSTFCGIELSARPRRSRR